MEPLPVGVTVQKHGVLFRVWAPTHRHVTVVIETDQAGTPFTVPEMHPLMPEGNGYFSASVLSVGPGCLYRYQLDDDGLLYPDPASKFQPQGPDGPSLILPPHHFVWTDEEWRGISPKDHVIYEMHVGTFTKEGTWRAAAKELAELRRMHITTIQMLPIADFPGRFGWGYDAVNLFAPSRLYGEPDDLKYFINAAHAVGLAVILDLAYNHLGPQGNFLKHFSPYYFSSRYHTDWGEALNFDGEYSTPVREFFLANVHYWIEEFHFDGVRLDATQNIYDTTTPHIISDIVATAEKAGNGRHIFTVVENEPQCTRLIRNRKEGGYGAHAAANDDFHHAAIVAMTGRNEAYYTDYLGSPQEFISLAKRGYLYQGLYYEWQKQRRGTYSFDLPAHKFVNFIENHDQVANAGRGYRSHTQTSPGRYRALTALLLLFPQIPMLFQGQEFCSSAHFYYFADHHQGLARKVMEGRRVFLHQFPSLSTIEMQRLLPDPSNPTTFIDSKLDLRERHTHQNAYALHQDLLQLRTEVPIFKHAAGGIDGAVLGVEAFVLRYFGEESDDRLLLVNLGRDLHLHPAPEPLLAPLAQMGWEVEWSSEDPKYGGTGAVSYEGPHTWHLPGHAAVVLKPQEI